jgi:hypothetical protein
MSHSIVPQFKEMSQMLLGMNREACQEVLRETIADCLLRLASS